MVSIFLELSNAFDSFDHEFILHNLTLGFGGPALCRLGSYLKGIHQFLEVKQIVNRQIMSGRSSLLPVLGAVPKARYWDRSYLFHFFNDLFDYIKPLSYLCGRHCFTNIKQIN